MDNATDGDLISSTLLNQEKATFYSRVLDLAHTMGVEPKSHRIQIQLGWSWSPYAHDEKKTMMSTMISKVQKLHRIYKTTNNWNNIFAFKFFVACTSGFIGKPPNQQQKQNQIQTISTNQLQTPQRLYHVTKDISRCNFTDSCSKVLYLNASSGTAWQHTTLHTCFDVSINTDNFTDPFAELKVYLQIYFNNLSKQHFFNNYFWSTRSAENSRRKERVIY